MRFGERKKLYAISFQKAREKVEVLMMDKEFKITYPIYVEYLNITIKSFFLNNPQRENLVYSYKSFVSPIREYLIQYGRAIDYSFELMMLLNDVSAIYTGIEMASLQGVKDYEYYASGLQNASEKLERESEQFRKDFTL